MPLGRLLLKKMIDTNMDLKTYIRGYQDGGYDTLKSIPERIKNCLTVEDVIILINMTTEAMKKMSTRKLGCGETYGDR
jgi:hypothetical protein